MRRIHALNTWKKFRLEKENDARKKRKRCKVGGEIGDIDKERENDEKNKGNKTKKKLKVGYHR